MSSTMLHILRHAPQDDTHFASSLRVMGPHQGLLLWVPGRDARGAARTRARLSPRTLRSYSPGLH